MKNRQSTFNMFKRYSKTDSTGACQLHMGKYCCFCHMVMKGWLIVARIPNTWLALGQVVSVDSVARPLSFLWVNAKGFYFYCSSWILNFNVMYLFWSGTSKYELYLKLKFEHVYWAQDYQHTLRKRKKDKNKQTNLEYKNPVQSKLSDKTPKSGNKMLLDSRC